MCSIIDKNQSIKIDTHMLPSAKFLDFIVFIRFINRRSLEMMMMINFISVSSLLAGHVRPTNRGH